MIAVAMPLFNRDEFLTASLAWLSENPLAFLVTFAGILACGFVWLLWHDTRDDARSEMDDTAPRVQKVVQIKDGAAVYTAEDYRALVERQTLAKQFQTDADYAHSLEKRVFDEWEANRKAHRETMAAKWAQRKHDKERE